MERNRKLYRTSWRFLAIALIVVFLIAVSNFLDFEERKKNRSGTIQDLSCFADFEMQDFNGNKVTQDVYKGYKLTVINTWETTCTACVGEMPALEALSEEYEGKGVQFIGMCADIPNEDGSLDETLMQDALDLVDSTGVTYPQMIPSQEVMDTFVEPIIVAYPTTVFVDSEGKVLFVTTGSKDKDGWKEAIDEYLAALS